MIRRSLLPPSGGLCLPAVKRSSPQFRGLMAWWWFGARTNDRINIPDLMGGAPLTQINSGTIAQDVGAEWGRGVYLDGVDDAYYAPQASVNFVAALEATIAVRYQPLVQKPTGGGALFWEYTSSGSTGERIALKHLSTGYIQAVVRDGATTTTQSVTSPDRVTAGADYHIAATFSDARDELCLYINGIRVAINTAATAVLSSDTPVGNSQLGRGVPSTTYYLLSRFFDLRLRRVCFSPEEIWHEYDPRTRWDLFQVPPRSYNTIYIAADLGAAAGSGGAADATIGDTTTYEVEAPGAAGAADDVAASRESLVGISGAAGSGDEVEAFKDDERETLEAAGAGEATTATKEAYRATVETAGAGDALDAVNYRYGQWLGEWKQRIRIDIDAAKVVSGMSFGAIIRVKNGSGTGSADLTPVFDEIGANYLKIAVTRADGITEEYVEVESWNASAEEGVLHVRAIGNDDYPWLYLYFDAAQADNPNVGKLEDGLAAWPYGQMGQYINAGYGDDGVVFHFAQTPDLSGDDEADHCIFNSLIGAAYNDVLQGVPTGCTGADLVDGAIDSLSALHLDSGKRLDVHAPGPDYGYGPLCFNGPADNMGSVGVEIVLSIDAYGYGSIVQKWCDSLNAVGWVLSVEDDGSGLFLRFRRGYKTGGGFYEVTYDAWWESAEGVLDYGTDYHICFSHIPAGYYYSASDTVQAWITEIGSADIAAATTLSPSYTAPPETASIKDDSLGGVRIMDEADGTLDECRIGYGIAAERARTLYHAFNDSLLSYGAVELFGWSDGAGAGDDTDAFDGDEIRGQSAGAGEAIDTLAEYNLDANGAAAAGGDVAVNIETEPDDIFGAASGDAAEAEIVVTIPAGRLRHRWFVRLTGAPDGLADTILPADTIEIRQTSGRNTWLRVVVPGSEYGSAIKARPNGEIVAQLAAYRDGSEITREEICRVPLQHYRIAQAKNCEAWGIAQTNASTPKSVTLSGAAAVDLSGGRLQYRLPTPDLYLRPGDTVTVDDGPAIEAGEIEYRIEQGRTAMTVATGAL